MPRRFDPQLAVFTCRHVLDGAAHIALVAHDDEGDWQFLCAKQSHRPADGRVVCLHDLLAIDATVKPLLGLVHGQQATRTDLGKAWQRTDEHIEFIEEMRAKVGWAVQLVPPDGQSPPFAFTVGLTASYGAPELLLFGLPNGVMQSILNLLGERVKRGERFTPTTSIRGVIKGLELNVRPVRSRTARRAFTGLALRYYQSQPFELLQVLYPDAQGRFPSERGVAPAFRRQQPRPR